MTTVFQRFLHDRPEACSKCQTKVYASGKWVLFADGSHPSPTVLFCADCYTKALLKRAESPIQVVIVAEELFGDD